jgi:formylglycine-generating enzyme required for sulfatase activity
MVYNTGDDAPMYWVSWEDGVAFCRKLTERERAAGRLPAGYEYRLPTEAEWEYACRAGTTEATYAGNLVIAGRANAPVLDRIAWYRGNSSEGYMGNGVPTVFWEQKQYPGGTAAQRTVATKLPNAWGLYDMLGNVWECCGDWYVGKLPGGSVSDPSGPASGVMRVVRGGCWYRAPGVCRAAFRGWAPAGARYNSVGFRLALAPQSGR